VFEKRVTKLSGKPGYIDVFWEGVLLAEHKSRGQNLEKATEQAFGYLHGLSDEQLPRYLIVSDFERFLLHDLERNDSVAEFTLRELPANLEYFGFMAGFQATEIRPEDPVNAHAAERMGLLHDKLAATGYTGHRLERVEKFISALTFRSQMAKAAYEGARYLGHDADTDDIALAAAVTQHSLAKALEARVERLETGSWGLPTSPQSEGETTLAKAQGALRTDADILAAASQNPAITPLEMGVISSHLSQGNYTAARRTVIDAAERQTLAKASDLATETMTAIDQPAPDTDDAELREAFVRLEATISTIVSRLDRLEARRLAVSQGRSTVAKAQGQAKKRHSMNDLFQMLAYVDSPTQTGALSAMLQSGDVQQIRAAERSLVAAKRNHEAQRVRAERRGWQ
jgi:hypothetical protein